MSREQYGLMLVLAVVAGLVGSVVLNLLFIQQVGVIRAEKFELVDKDGQIRAELRLESDGSPSLARYDKDGKVIGSK